MLIFGCKIHETWSSYMFHVQEVCDCKVNSTRNFLVVAIYDNGSFMSRVVDIPSTIPPPRFDVLNKVYYESIGVMTFILYIEL